MYRARTATSPALKAIRRSFENETGLRTFAANKWDTGGLFDADAPFNEAAETAVLAWLERAEKESGKALTFSIRNTRMTIDFATEN